MIACLNSMTKMFAKIEKSFGGLSTTITSLNTMAKMFAIIAKAFIGCSNDCCNEKKKYPCSSF